MTATNRLRVATIDTARAIDTACSEVESAVGLPVHLEFHEIECGNLIIEFRLGNETIHTPTPHNLPLLSTRPRPT
jgi:hypothetical protein